MRSRPLPAALLILLLGCGAAMGGEKAERSGGVVKENRLARERSPYLRQHRANPVDWFPWGAEALDRAREEGRPIFLSVGYAACHWCHVMEHESFEDEETAALLNQAFVCVKVDREERPDLDALYMRAVQVMSGRGGWPMTVVLTPEGDPFFAGTYLPRERLQDLVRRISAAWVRDPEGIRQQASLVTERVADLAHGQELPPFEGGDGDLLRILDTSLAANFDARNGGYGGAPKFPPHAELLYLLDRIVRDGAVDGLDQLRGTLDGMDEGGVHDHVGGGFHRYSTDAVWLLPHFEKMLYDNALLAQVYARAAAATGDERYARVGRGILGWVVREMARPDGGYASSLDADTDGEEGRTYTWTEDQVRRALPREDVDLALRVFGVQEAGNFRDEATGRTTGRNVLHLPSPLGDLAPRVDGIRLALRKIRDLRPQPGLDDKVITAWNGLLLSAFVHCGTALDDQAWLEKGRELATYLLEACRREDGVLLRFPRASGPEIVGFCDDHVHLAEGLLDLADATGESRWADAARELGDRLLDEFEDPAAGGFFSTSKRWHEKLFGRQKETFDSPIPSENGTATRLLLRLFARTGEARYGEGADRALSTWRPLLGWARAARGTVALYRALALRLSQRQAADVHSAPGDVTLASDLVQVDAFFERTIVQPGKHVRVAIRVSLEEGWHVNAHRPSAPDLVATVLEAEAGAPAVLEGIRYPVPVSRALVPDGAPIDLLEGIFWIRVTLLAPADAPPGPRKIPLVLTLQPCNATSCQAPRELRLQLPLRFDPEADETPRHAGLFGD